MKQKNILTLGVLFSLVFLGAGCQQLFQDQEEPETNIEEQLPPPPQEDYRRQAGWNLYDSSEDSFSVEHPENTEVSEQGDGLYYLTEKLGPEDTPTPDIKLQLRTISTSEYIQELFDSGPRPENITLDPVYGGKEQIFLIKYFPEKGNVDYSCPSYIIEAEPQSVIISPWECFDIDYIEELVKSFKFSE